MGNFVFGPTTMNDRTSLIDAVDSDKEHGPTNNQMDCVNFTDPMDCPNLPDDPKDCSNLPNEIFEHHIWKHFSFNRWIRVFSLVCKKWKQICEESTVDPKQIQIELKKTSDTGRYMQIVKKYQPTILRVKLHIDDYMEDFFLVHRLCEASTRLHTLVLECTRYNLDIYINSIKPINNITTLALKVVEGEKFWKNLHIIFPNVKRLQVEQPDHPFNIKVDHLTLVIRSDYYLKKFVVNPDVVIIRRDKVIVTKLVGSDPPHSRALTYEEYFRYFGDTELMSAVNSEHRNISRAEKLLRSGETTMEYEKQLYDSRDLYYEYPSAISTPLFDSKAYWSPIIDVQMACDTLFKTNLIPVPSVEKFIAFANFKKKNEALAELRKIDEAFWTAEKVGYKVIRAFFNQLLPLATKAELHQKRYIEKVKKIVQSADAYSIQNIEVKDFKKISDLRDWSNQFALTNSVGLCYAMVDAGCKISRDYFKDLADYEDVGVIIDLLVKKRDPSNLVHALVYFPLEKLRTVLNKHNISITVERNGKSLFNKRIRRLIATEEELNEYKHLVNHMDSSGRTPLSVALHRPHIQTKLRPMVQKLLELGADPTLHRGDKLSPLGSLLVKCSRDLEKHIVDLINLLVVFGADVNAPCLFEKRMCSPLMIAVLMYIDKDIISFLIALGCRTDYVDETGRTMMDCASEQASYYKEQIAKLLNK